MKRSILFCGLLAAGLALAPAAWAGPVDVGAYVKEDLFQTIKISPDGNYYAAIVPQGDKTTLAILSRGDNKVTASFHMGDDTHVANVWWVNPERVLIAMAVKHGGLEQPLLTGELFGMNADGSKQMLLVGQRVAGSTGSRVKSNKAEFVVATLIDDLPDDDAKVLISVSNFDGNDYTRVEQMDVYTGRRLPVTRAPLRGVTFMADRQGVVRFARGATIENANQLFYREGDGAEWSLVNDEAKTGRIELPRGFSEDGRTAYLQVEQAQGPDAIVTMDVASRQRREVLRDDDSDPLDILYQAGTWVPVGAILMDGKPRTAFFDPASKEARLYRSLEAAFPGEAPFITSMTADGKLALVQVSSDRNPGDFFVFDTVSKKAAHLISRRSWLDPTNMAEQRPVNFKARDGLPLRGYLTLPKGSTGKGLPLVILPHGGPIGIVDVWGFDDGGQLLAAAGYAVLQVNFRGSGFHGRAFQQAGAREWGGKMQDDLTDATRWAVSEGIADASRICIYGASYGGYAALMGVAKEPDLYKCAAGYVGVYDLPAMHAEGSSNNKRGEHWQNDWVGERAALGAVSPNRMADKIKVPVFLAAGGEDEIAPIEHSKMMERALIKAGVPVETLYYPTEAHGFYVEAHRKEFYTRLLAFLARNIGGATAAGSGTTAAK